MFFVAEKKSVRRKMFSTKAFRTSHSFYKVQTTQNWCCLGRKHSKTNVAYLIEAAKIFAQREFFSTWLFARYTNLTEYHPHKKCCFYATNSRKTVFSAINGAAEKIWAFARYKIFTETQSHKNSCCLSTNSQKTHFAALLETTKNLCDVDISQPSHSAYQTLFTKSQLHKKAYC